MKSICVIIGGGSGMGLATAKILGKDFYIIIAGRSMDKLENALVELRAEGIKALSSPVMFLSVYPLTNLQLTR